MASFAFELVSPERLLFGGDVESVVVPGTEGEFTVLKDHAPLMSTLKPGVVTVTETGAKETRLFVRGGFADVAPTGLTILAESAVSRSNSSTPLSSTPRSRMPARTSRTRRATRHAAWRRKSSISSMSCGPPFRFEATSAVASRRGPLRCVRSS